MLSEADTSILFSNDSIMSICAKRLAKRGSSNVAKPVDIAASDVRISDLNKYIAMALAGHARYHPTHALCAAQY